MAYMAWRERNRAKWVGIRPGHYGVEISKHGSASNAAADIHTVSAGKTFFLSFLHYHGRSDGANNYNYVSIRNAAGVVQYILAFALNNNVRSYEGAHSYSQPIEVPAGYLVTLHSQSVNAPLYAFIHGWEDAFAIETDA